MSIDKDMYLTLSHRSTLTMSSQVSITGSTTTLSFAYCANKHVHYVSNLMLNIGHSKMSYHIANGMVNEWNSPVSLQSTSCVNYRI